MKVVADTMIWVSYSVSEDGFRHRLIEAARRARVRFFVSDYILAELATTLVEDFDRPPRYVNLACQRVRRIAKTVTLALPRRGWVPTDPDDDPIIHTSLVAKADYLLTEDQKILRLKQVEDVRIIQGDELARIIGLRHSI